MDIRSKVDKSLSDTQEVREDAIAAKVAAEDVRQKVKFGVFHNADDPQTNFLLASKNIRESVMQGMDKLKEPWLASSRRSSREHTKFYN